MQVINLGIKRAFDVLLSSVAIIVLMPIWIGIAIAIKKDSKGPVFFKQGRRTRDGKVFQMLKFRSMIVDAEKIGTGLFNFENDPRVTKVGRKLRDASLDELPQLFNIFCGHMTIVGPRPCVTYELGDFETLNNKYKKRFQVKAGLTGLAQVKGRNNISWGEKVIYDNQYVDMFKKYGVIVDVKILLESVMKILRKNDIYEKKIDDTMSDIEAAKAEEEEIVRLAHEPDETN